MRSGLLAWVLLLLALIPADAQAYPWMIKHGYTNCLQCHVDPSGGGVLTAYGRAQGEILVRTHYERMTEDPGKKANFLYGLVDLPEPLALQADLRGLLIPEPGNVRAVLMQADVRGAVTRGPVVASGAIGVVSAGAQGAWLTSGESGWNLVSREYWVGVLPMKGMIVRAGRMNLPFGLRTEDHLLYVRSATRTTLNDDQQLGASVAYTSKHFRFEVMGIAGNLHLKPDLFRERGYSLYATWAPEKTIEIGVSSLYTVAGADVDTLAPRTRQAHGAFTRFAPIEPVAVLAELDLLLSDDDGARSSGIVGNAIVDWEVTQGVHLLARGGYCDNSFADPATPAWTAGGAVHWFLAPRFDLRMDIFQGVLYCTPGAMATPMGLLQGHFYL